MSVHDLLSSVQCIQEGPAKGKVKLQNLPLKVFEKFGWLQMMEGPSVCSNPRLEAMKLVYI
jgi:hypothetical protein